MSASFWLCMGDDASNKGGLWREGGLGGLGVNVCVHVWGGGRVQGITGSTAVPRFARTFPQGGGFSEGRCWAVLSASPCPLVKPRGVRFA